VRKADNLPTSCAVVTKSGNLNFLEPSGPVQACNWNLLPLFYRLNMFRALLCPSPGARDYNVDYHIGRSVLSLVLSLRAPDDGHSSARNMLSL